VLLNLVVWLCADIHYFLLLAGMFVCVCIIVCERERERARASVCVCTSACVCVGGPISVAMR